jgi:hypothetical protein
MPGLMMTARVFLFIVGGVQAIGGLIYAILAATIDDVSSAADGVAAESGTENPFAEIGDFAAGALLTLAVVLLALSALSITLGVKLSTGGQGIRITTAIYGGLGALVGVFGLINAANLGSSAAMLFAVLWLVFGGIMLAAMVTGPGAAWFNRPRY